MTATNSRGFTLIELMIVVAIIAILAEVAIPSFMKSNKNFNESNAINRLSHVKSAQVQFQALDTDGDGTPGPFATDLSELVSAGVLNPGYALSPFNGYTVSLTGSTSTWNATATATNQGVTGDRSFYVDESGILRSSAGPGANASSPPLGS